MSFDDALKEALAPREKVAPQPSDPVSVQLRKVASDLSWWADANGDPSEVYTVANTLVGLACRLDDAGVTA